MRKNRELLKRESNVEMGSAKDVPRFGLSFLITSHFCMVLGANRLLCVTDASTTRKRLSGADVVSLL